MSAGSQQSRKSVEQPLSRAAYEDFLFEEAAMLDEWRLGEWLALFTEDAVYEVPRAGADETADSAEDLFYIADNYFRLGHRVKRMLDKAAHAEWPRSVQSHMISNVRIKGSDEEGVHVSCRFITHRAKNEIVDTYAGHHNYILRTVDGKLRIASKRTFIASDSLRDQGKVTIIL
ncbi:aromatic-ring-hydroxylating dioxygenase subunit beta [Henriciella aquimarina]|uniref:aromatic-ring-hydroxylating dioxygenase subunit beta n=1 Tax=Henriciella aquimarina TaxID=545261 RepID=UPI000A02C629|nr:aromatic-ring-hydroxylating dioxygenase subunit beta [Henriciella aquimarina]